MKKLVPDPPNVLCIKPGLTHHQAICEAADHVNKALEAARQLPDQHRHQNQTLLKDAVLDLKIAKAMLSVAMARSTLSVPI